MKKRSRKHKRTESIFARVKPGERKALEAHADRRGMTISELVRHAMDYYLNPPDEKKE